MPKVFFAISLVGICWGILGAAAAHAQQPLGGMPPMHTQLAPGSAPLFTSPTVSPYVNLGVNSNGVSNYQTLVRPMIEDRELILRQAQMIQQLQQGAVKSPARPAVNGRDAKEKPGSNSHFMNFSHYYGK